MDTVLISPVFPFDPRDGHRLAVLSDVHAFLDSGHRVGLISFGYGEEQPSMEPLCPHVLIPALGGGFAPRLLRGILKGLPPSAERLYGASMSQKVRETLRSWSPRLVVIDDASGAGYIPLIREVLPAAKVVVRSHNVMHDVRLDQLKRTTGWTRPAIRFDCQRYIEFERKSVEMADAHWAITGADADRMTELYGRPTSCLTVSVPLQRYESLHATQGRSNGFVHVGTIDFRRRSELGNFLTECWPKVLQADSQATLTLAGMLHGDALPATNVVYSGRVRDDAEVYGLGRFALNFQSSTGGVKLKTLTSLAAGRTLVSTAEGVEGLPLESERHYWDVNRFLSSPDLKEMMRDAAFTQPIADAGRSYVMANHSRAAVAQQLGKLLQGVY